MLFINEESRIGWFWDNIGFQFWKTFHIYRPKWYMHCDLSDVGGYNHFFDLGIVTFYWN